MPLGPTSFRARIKSRALGGFQLHWVSSSLYSEIAVSIHVQSVPPHRVYHVKVYEDECMPLVVLSTISAVNWKDVKVVRPFSYDPQRSEFPIAKSKTFHGQSAVLHALTRLLPNFFVAEGSLSTFAISVCVWICRQGSNIIMRNSYSVTCELENLRCLLFLNRWRG